MIALGWCLAKQALPHPLSCAGAGDPVSVMCAPTDCGQTARDRICLLQRAFDAGVDLVPLSPARAWPVAFATEVAIHGTDDLIGQLSRVSGHGQLTLRADWPPIADSPPNGQSGRDWLARLRDRRSLAVTRASMAQDVLGLLCTDIAAPQRLFRPEGTGFVLHLLVPRDSVAQSLDRIAVAAKAATLPNGGSVTVSGLWPAFDFVHSPRCLEPVSQ